MVTVRIPIIAVSVRIIVYIPGTAGVIVIVGVTVWIIGFPLVAIIGKWVVPPACHAARIIIRGVSAAKNPTWRKPDLLMTTIRLC